MPRAVKGAGTAARIRTSSPGQGNARDIGRCPARGAPVLQSGGNAMPERFPVRHMSRPCSGSGSPLRFRQSARPRCFDARRTSFRARVPAVSGFRDLAIRLGGREEDRRKVRGRSGRSASAAHPPVEDLRAVRAEPCPANRLRCAAVGDGIRAGPHVMAVASGARTGGASAGNSAVPRRPPRPPGSEGAARAASLAGWPGPVAFTGSASPALPEVTPTARISISARAIRPRERLADPPRSPDGSCATSGPRHRSGRLRERAASSRHACACALLRACTAPSGPGSHRPFALDAIRDRPRTDGGRCLTVNGARAGAPSGRGSRWSRPLSGGISRRRWRRDPVSLCRRDRVRASGTDQPRSPLAQRQGEAKLEGKAGLHRRVATGLPAAMPPGGHRVPLDRGIEPDRQRPARPHRRIACAPVGGAAGRLRQPALAVRLRHWSAR